MKKTNIEEILFKSYICDYRFNWLNFISRNFNNDYLLTCINLNICLRKNRGNVVIF